jgi:glutamate/tyrosine decarboxylase-like PLP-dependent enzyme
MLELSPDEMRALGYRAVDMMVDHLSAIADQPVFGTAARAEMEARLREPPPAEGRGWEAVLQRVGDEVFRPMTHLTHPRFFAYVPGPSHFVGAIADALASGFNPFAGAWAMSPGAAQVELVTADWLREALGGCRPPRAERSSAGDRWPTSPRWRSPGTSAWGTMPAVA